MRRGAAARAEDLPRMRGPTPIRTGKEQEMTLTHKTGIRANHKVTFYGLSTCGWCRRAKEFLDANDVDYQFVYVDLAQGTDRTEASDRVRELNPRGSFPTIQIDDEVVVGFDEERMSELLGL